MILDTLPPFSLMASLLFGESLAKANPLLNRYNIRCTALRQSPIIPYPDYGILARGPELSLPRS